MLAHPILPMLAKRVDDIPAGGAWSFEPKWDGFRALFFRDGDTLFTQSRAISRWTATFRAARS